MFSFLKSKKVRVNLNNSQDNLVDIFDGYESKRNFSPLKVDQSNYPELLDLMLENNEVSTSQAGQLLQFHHDGFCTLNLDEPDAFYEKIHEEMDGLWKDAPDDLLGSGAYVPNGRLQPLNSLMEMADKDTYRSPGSRIIDSHSHSSCAEKLYLHPQIHSIIDLILEQKCLATQSLYFEYGSTQALHRDPWFVVTKPNYNLVACWVALEDIHVDSGPLSYVEKSHRWPFLCDKDDNIILHAPSADESFKSSVYKHLNSLLGSSDTKRSPFLAKKGQVFIWHGGLVHGGTPVVDETRTRKSFVVHFDAKETASRRGSRFTSKGSEEVVYTERMVSKDNAFGYKNPLSG